MMKLWHAIVSGLAGSAALTILHETARRVTPQAPRMDVLGMRAIEKGMQKADINPPSQQKLYGLAMLGDLIGNALYYSLVGIGPASKQVWGRGALLGLLAGLGGVALPGPMGLGSEPSNRTRATQMITVMLYLQAGLVSALVYRALGKRANRFIRLPELVE